MMTIRERIIAVADAQFDAHNEYDAGVSAIGLAAAREALLIAKERLRDNVSPWDKFVAAERVVDDLLADLSDGPPEAEDSK